MARSAGSLVTAGLLLLGLVLMVTPLALWVAWTDAIFLMVLATGAMAGVLYCVLVRFERPADANQSEASEDVAAGNLPGTMIEDLQNRNSLGWAPQTVRADSGLLGDLETLNERGPLP